MFDGSILSRVVFDLDNEKMRLQLKLACPDRLIDAPENLHEAVPPR